MSYWAKHLIRVARTIYERELATLVEEKKYISLLFRSLRFSKN